MDFLFGTLLSATIRYPVRVWLSRDNRIGVSVLRLGRRPSNQSGNSSRTDVSNVNVFFQPQVSCFDSKNACLKMERMEIRREEDHLITPSTVLWKVTKVPCLNGAREEPRSFPDTLNRPGYLVVLDQGQSFCLTWFLESRWNLDQWGCRSDSECRGDGNRFPSQSCYPGVVKYRWAKAVQGKPRSSDNAIILACQARLDPLAIARHHISCTQPAHREAVMSGGSIGLTHELIAICDGGQRAEVMIAYQLLEIQVTVGLVVRVNLWTQQYQVLSTERRETTRRFSEVSATFLKDYLRERQKRSYPVSVRYVRMGNSAEEEDSDTRHDESDFVAVPDADCDVFSNEAIRSQHPVDRIQCRSEPIELVYG